MASLLVAAAGVTGPIGWVLAAAAAYVDSQVIVPALMGKGKQAARPPRLLDIPVGSNEPGAPRIWAIGRQVRVPTHVLWQSEKVIEQTAVTRKRGTTVDIRRVYVDCLLALNDRRTAEMSMLIGNGKLLAWTSRNITGVRSSSMSVVESGGNLVVAMDTEDAPDFSDRFAAGDFVKLKGFEPAPATPTPNNLFLQVLTVSPHAGSPSSMTLARAEGQTVTGVNATGGSPTTPAEIEKIDDTLLIGSTMVLRGTNDTPRRLRISGFARDCRDVFNVGDRTRFRGGWTYGVLPPPGLHPEQIEWIVRDVSESAIGLQPVQTLVTTLAGNLEPGRYPFTPAPADTNMGRIEFWATPSGQAPTTVTSLFKAGFNPKDHYFEGSETQGESSILVADKGTGNVPAYRGLAYQGIEQFFVNQFGGQLPFAMEAVIRPDEFLSWQQAARLVLERGGIPPQFIDESGVSRKTFEGMFLRGPVPTATAIQPMLVAGQIIDQERDGTIALFEVTNADVVRVENGAQFSHLGARISGEDAIDDKITREMASVEDLPTSIGIRHQDPDNLYADGYQHFGVRNPSGVEHENRQEFDLSNLVLTRSAARNLAATLMRRAHINSTQVRVTLDAHYLHVLENDLLTLTDDDGNDLTIRVIQRDIGSNFLVKIVGLVEDVDLAVTGSPVQSGAGLPPPVIITAPTLLPVVLDMPSLNDEGGREPGLYFAVCAGSGGRWAGATLYESLNGGEDWSVATSFATQHAIGILDDDFAASTPAETFGSDGVEWDDVSTLTVRLENLGVQGGLFSQHDYEVVENGANRCAIIAPDGTVEIAAFGVVVQDDERTFTLSHWLRGLRGTGRQAARIAASGSKFVLIDPLFNVSGRFRRYPGANQTRRILFAFVPTGRSIADVDPIEVSATWRNARPFPVRSLSKAIGASPYDVTFTTQHWTRTHLRLGSLGPYPMDETHEAYRFTLYDATGGPAVLAKTISAQGSGSRALRDKSVTFTAAELSAAGYTPGPSETFWVDCQQVGDYGIGPSIKQEL